MNNGQSLFLQNDTDNAMDEPCDQRADFKEKGDNLKGKLVLTTY